LTLSSAAHDLLRLAEPAIAFAEHEPHLFECVRAGVVALKEVHELRGRLAHEIRVEDAGPGAGAGAGEGSATEAAGAAVGCW
jgi:hypothetical protein